MILALDTSTAIASIALYDGSVVAELTWRSGRNHSVELMAQASSLMQLKRVATSQLRAVAVATGPGSYTGLRVGLAAGKGLCLALGIPMIGVCSLDLLAEPHKEVGVPVRPLLDAGRHRYATALYLKQDDGFRRNTPIEGRSLAEVVESIKEETLLCGDISDLSCSDRTWDNSLIRVVSPAASFRRAGFLGEIAWERLGRGEVEDPRLVDARYLGREDG